MKLTTKTPGPPTLGKHEKDDVARDRNGRLWECVKRGTPGTWAPCATDECDPAS